VSGEIGWRTPGVPLQPGMFVARVGGKSIEPLIPDGSWSLFRPCPVGSREGRTLLVQLASLGVGENRGRFTVKKYNSEKMVTAYSWRHDRIQLLPANPAIALEQDATEKIIIDGEVINVVALDSYRKAYA